MENNLDVFRRNLRACREHKGLRTSDMFENLGVKLSAWSNYERGVSEPNLPLLMNISDFFEISETNLLRNTHLMEDIAKGKISLKNTPKSTPNYTPNPEIYLQFNEEQGLYMKKSDADIVLTHMRDTMKTKDALITALDRENAMLRAQLDECKKALKVG